jgi:hypothetical protein
MLRLFAAAAAAAGDLEVFAFADVEIDLDRIDGRHGGQFGRMLGLRRSPICALAMPAMPVTGEVMRVKPRLSFAVLQRRVGGLELRLGRKIGAGGIVEVLLADRVLGRQRLDAGEVGRVVS